MVFVVQGNNSIMVIMKTFPKLWAARLLIAVVTLMNLQAAFQFMLQPERFAPGFEMNGTTGTAMTQGMGLLFLMWNIPYLFALIHPIRNFVSLVEAVIMQFIGVGGESLSYLKLTGEHPLLRSSVERFILFDGAGLILLLAALCITVRIRRMQGLNG